MAATIGQKHKNGFKIVEIWDNHSESLKNNLYNDFKGPEHLLGGMNLENEIDTCQTTVQHPIIGETNVFQKKTQSFSSGGLMYSLYVMCQLYCKELS